MATRRRGAAGYSTPSLDLFGPAGGRGGQLGFDLRAPDAPNLAAEDTARRQRIAALERQRDALRKAGWRTADLDEMIARLSARNPTWAMYRDANGVLHPIRSWFKGRGRYDPSIEQRRAKLIAKARGAKLFHPALKGGPAQHIEVLRQEGERKLQEAEQLAAERAETPSGSFEERYGIARPPLGESARKAQRLERELSKLVLTGKENDKTRRLEAQIRQLRAQHQDEPITAYWAQAWKRQGSKVKPKGVLSERDILRLWAVYHRDQPDVPPTDDWYRDVAPDQYHEAIHGSLDPRYAVEAARAAGKARIARLAAQGRRDLSKAAAK